MTAENPGFRLPCAKYRGSIPRHVERHVGGPTPAGPVPRSATSRRGAFTVAAGLAILCAVPSPTARAQDAPDAVVPALAAQSPRLRFHLGEVEDNQPKISPVLPDMPGAPSPWYVAQWNQSSVIGPQALTRDDPATRDPRLGVAAYAFTAPDRHSHVWIYRDGPSGSWAYELYERGGRLTAGGGSNLFLATSAVDPHATFDHTISYALDARIAKAAIRYDTPDAERTGAVLAQAFTGFGLMFTDPATHDQQFVFMQLPIAVSRPIPPDGNTMCSLHDGRPSLLYSPGVPQGELLPYRDDPGGMHHLRYDLTGDLRHLLATGYRCGGRWMTWPAPARDPRTWRLTGLYVGLETEASDDRPQARTHAPQGSVETALQIAGLRLTRDGR